MRSSGSRHQVMLGHVQGKLVYAQYANNEGTYHTAHPRSLISACNVRSLESTILARPKISRLQNLCTVGNQNARNPIDFNVFSHLQEIFATASQHTIM